MMRRTFQLAVMALILSAAGGVRAQILSSDVMVARPPRNPAQVPVKPAGSLEWLWAFTKPEPLGRAGDLRYDARFHALLAENFNRAQAMWGPEPGHNPPLDAVIPLFLSKYGTVTAQRNRYVAIDGCVPEFCAAHGMLWVDLGRAKPLMIFAGVNWSPESHTTDEASANYELWIYPNREISADELPVAFTESVAHWELRLAAAHRLVPHIAHALLVEPSGAPRELTPALVGANAIAPQPDTTAQEDQPARSTELKPRN